MYPSSDPLPQYPAGAVRACWPVIWLTGLIAVIFLWLPCSAARFKTP